MASLNEAADWLQVRAHSQHGLSSQNNGPNHLELRCNALP